jgi:hypothetical protein
MSNAVVLSGTLSFHHVCVGFAKAMEVLPALPHAVRADNYPQCWWLPCHTSSYAASVTVYSAMLSPLTLQHPLRLGPAAFATVRHGVQFVQTSLGRNNAHWRLASRTLHHGERLLI